MGIIEAISNLAKAVASVFGFAAQRDAEKNTPEMRQALEAKRESALVDETRKAIAKDDLEEIRKEVAE